MHGRKQLSWIRRKAPYSGMDDCIIVTSHSSGSAGYPRTNIGGRSELIHREVCRRKFRIIGEFKSLHSCDVRTCINPNHISSGTDADNVCDMLSKGREAFGDKSGRAKLTNQQAREIFSAPGTQKDISIQFNVSPSTVSLIKNRKKWRRVTI